MPILWPSQPKVVSEVEVNGLDHPIAGFLERRLSECIEEVDRWLGGLRSLHGTPLHCSFDVRDAGWKVATVDANAFPAGSNNPPLADRKALGSQMKSNIERHHPEAERILLLPESNTRNIGYGENVRILHNLLSSGGYEVVVGSPRLNGVERLVGIDGSVELVEVDLQGDDAIAGGSPVDLIILNDDLTSGSLPMVSTPVLPPTTLGWYQRRKSGHFRSLQPLIGELAEILGVDPWLLGTHWFVSEDKCLEKEVCRIELAAEVDRCLEAISTKHREHGIDREPAMFVKNDQGTYGLGILRITSGEELLHLSNRRMNRLTYGKGGSDVADFLLQESVPTALFDEGKVLEPCGYAADGLAVGWFLRSNSKRGDEDNLNTPSSGYVHVEDLNHESRFAVLRRRQLHRIVCEVGSVAIAIEANHDG